uniref:Ig-like domain-containing protein n=1 Tax=Sparus aurata TaxID=8175 RepID=A0A671Y4B9_SPAAU
QSVLACVSVMCNGRKQSEDTLVPVTTVELGEPATFTCAFSNALISRRSIQWYKQSAGDLLKLIVTRQKSTQPEYAPEFPASRFQVNSNDNFSNLTILRTRQEDEGMYHCAVSEWIIKTVWSGTYLLLKAAKHRSDTQKSCVYHFSKKVSSSDAGTYYCAVATCGEILFGNGAKVETGMILNSVLEVIYKHVDDMIIDAFFSLLSRLSKNEF